MISHAFIFACHIKNIKKHTDKQIFETRRSQGFGLVHLFKSRPFYQNKTSMKSRYPEIEHGWPQSGLNQALNHSSWMEQRHMKTVWSKDDCLKNLKIPYHRRFSGVHKQTLSLWHLKTNLYLNQKYLWSFSLVALSNTFLTLMKHSTRRTRKHAFKSGLIRSYEVSITGCLVRVLVHKKIVRIYDRCIVWLVVGILKS